MQYSIPTSKWNHYQPLREKLKIEEKKDFAGLIPGDARTYNYSTELPYLEMYASSLYCITKKKGGWDCLRHYEILLAGCVPYFFDIAKVPSRSMVHFPHDLVRRLMQLPGVPGEDFLASRLGKLGQSTNANVLIDRAVFPLNEYKRLRTAMLSYVESHMLCKSRASELHALPRVFIHSYATTEKPVDYLRELLLVGLMENGHEVYTTFNASYVFQDFDVSSLDAPWGLGSYGRGFLYERALPPSYRSRFNVWVPGDPPPDEPFSYIKTTYNNKPYPIETFFDKAVDIVVDGNDIWGAHPEPVSATWFRRELSDCHHLIKPARALLGILNSGALWNCEASPHSRLCPNLHDAARVWQYGLQMTAEVEMQTQGWRSPSGVEFLLDIEDYLRTPHYFPDFVEKFMILATNARQFMEWCRQLAETAARALGGDPNLPPPRPRLAEL
ncbi:Ccrn4l [Symbiodinium sp. CCMP2592]|nr:Ccrn4l [Symbiodinium sp. CCMP2592]